MSFPSSKNVFDYRYRGWRFPTLGFALLSNERILGHNRGLKEESLLISTLSAPIQTFDDKDLYFRLFEKVAALGFGVARNHAFHDGNKRTSLFIVEACLEWNGYYLEFSQDIITLIFSLLGAGHLEQAGFQHALLLGCGQDPVENIP